MKKYRVCIGYKRYYFETIKEMCDFLDKSFSFSTGKLYRMYKDDNAPQIKIERVKNPKMRGVVKIERNPVVIFD